MKQVFWVLVSIFLISSVARETPLKAWTLQTSANITATGDVISTPKYNDLGWHLVTVPCTVMAGLWPDPNNDLYYGDNLKKVDTKQFDVPWWYRTEFSLSTENPHSRVRIVFEGLNYRANVWFNGVLIGRSADIVGAYRYFDFDVTEHADFSLLNVLAVEISRPINSITDSTTVDLAITFVDWSPSPPDSSMGLWRDVNLVITGPLSVDYPAVVTKLSSVDMAHLTVMAEVTNGHNGQVKGVIKGTIEGVGTFSTPITLKPKEVQNVYFTNDSFPVLNVKNPALWWPWQMGAQNLHKLTLEVTVDSQSSDVLTVNFGIREATSELTPEGFRLYRINGQKILIRGAGWSPDLLLITKPDIQETHFQYMKDMFLNTVRLEGKMEDDHFMELADQYGILVMPGWCCCDSWQHWSHWKEEQFLIARESMISQVKRLRIHPSVFVFVYSSDELPPANVESVYLSVFKEHLWPNPTLSAASDRTSTLSGPTGVKMSGPYSWEPPNYWLIDSKERRAGGAFGFLTEGGPGENPLDMTSFALTIPKDKYWPINDVWNWHCGAQFGNFGNLNHFTPSLYARYGVANSAEDYLQKSQVAVYEAHRAFFEGYSRNKYVATGVIQWMLNTPFPEMIWHLYDYYFNPSSAYFATKRACEPVHILYSYDDDSIWVVNSLYTPQSDLQATAEVFNLDGKSLFRRSLDVPSIAPDSPKEIFTLPSISNLSSTYFLRLTLHNSTTTLSNNMYWLSTAKDVLDWDKSTWYQTPCKSYADFTLLQSLRKVDLNISSELSDSNAIVSVSNPGSVVAFFVHLRVVTKSGRADIWPIFWEDNYFTLLPGEMRKVTAKFQSKVEVDVVVEVWNNISGKGN